MPHSSMTTYERNYLRKASLLGLSVLAAHLPVLAIIALFNQSSLLVVLGVMVLLLAGPAAILFLKLDLELAPLALAVAAMGVSALTIHVSGGMIEAHFEIFTLLAMLTVFGRIRPLLIAGVVIALHHLIFWMWLPASVFNYKASLNIVLIHAGFVVFEIIPACWIARQFGHSIKAQSIVMESLGDAAEQIEHAAAQVSASSQSLARGATEQAGSSAEIATSANEINTTAHRNSESSSSAADIATETAARFEDANRYLGEMITAMDGIKISSQQISGIVRVIDQIAFQTNILALNAAVEAARAGDSGLGFAVVADEVRNLAQRSAQAAKETSNLIESSISSSEAGVLKVNQVTTAIRSINEKSARMKDLVTDIQSASQVQSININQVTKAMHQMESITQETAAGAEETAAAAEELTAQSHMLRSIVQELGRLSGDAATTARTELSARNDTAFWSSSVETAA